MTRLRAALPAAVLFAASLTAAPAHAVTEQEYRKQIDEALNKIEVKPGAGVKSEYEAPPIVSDARTVLNPYSVTVGLFHEAGGVEYGGWRSGSTVPVSATGVRYYERHGLISGTIAMIFQMAAAAKTGAGAKGSRTWEDSNYRYTETTYFSQSEKTAMNDRAAASGARLASSREQSFDLHLYSRNLGGTTSGYKANLYLYGFGKEAFYFETGFGGGHVDTAGRDGKTFLITSADYLGMPMKLQFAYKFLLTFAEFEWNWAGHSSKIEKGRFVDTAHTTYQLDASRNFPWRLGVAATVVGRLYTELAVVTPVLTSGVFGWNATLGARF